MTINSIRIFILIRIALKFTALTLYVFAKKEKLISQNKVI